MLWRRSLSLVPHGVMFGLPSVVGERKSPPAEPPEAVLWSRERWYVYDSDVLMPCGVNPLIEAVTCFASEPRLEFTLYTLPYALCTRELSDCRAPVVGTMAVGDTYTGRLASLESRNCGAAVFRLRSLTP